MFKISSFSSTIQRVMRNFAANAFGQVMNGVYQIISVPLFLHYWTKQGYGEWLVMFSIPGLLWSLEGGLAGVASNRMTVASATGNWELANSIFQNVFVMQGILCVILIGLGALVITQVDLRHYFGFVLISNHEAATILMLLIIYMLSSFYISLYRSAYRSSELEARGSMVNNLCRMSDFFIMVAVLIFGGHALTLAEALLACALFWTALLYFDVRRKCPRIEFGVRRASWQQSKSIFIDGAPLLAGQAATAFFFQGYPLVINRVLGASAVVNFAAVRTISRALLLMNQVVCNSSAPEVARSFGRQDWTSYVRLLKIMLVSAFFAGVATLLGLGLFGPWAIWIWTLGKVNIGHGPMILFSVSIALQGIWGVGSIVLVCSNMHHLYNYMVLVISLLSLATADFVLPRFGFIAVPGTMAVQDLALTIIVFTLCRTKLRHVSLGDFRALFSSDFYWGKVQALFNRAEF